MKEKRYGWKHPALGTRYEYEEKSDRDATCPGHLWKKYKVDRTVKKKGKPFWWAIKQLQEGRSVRDAGGILWEPDKLTGLLRDGAEVIHEAWAQGWKLNEEKKS